MTCLKRNASLLLLVVLPRPGVPVAAQRTDATIAVEVHQEATARVADTIVGPLGRRMHAHVSRAAALGFSGQVLVAVDGKVLLHRAYGYADRAGRRRLTTETPLGIASASKQFAGAAVLLLEQRGRLSRADSLVTYFPDAPPDKRSVTIHQLVTHTAGIRGGFTEDFESPSVDSSIARLLRQPLTSAPGGPWRYSSDAYNIVAAIVAKAAGMPYEEFVKRNLFAPASMASSGFWSDLSGDTARAPHTYVGFSDRGSPAVWPPDHRVFGSGDIVTTAGDLYRWVRAVDAGQVMSAETKQLYWTPQVPIERSDSYGYGLFFSTSPRGGRMIEHGGDTELGFNAALYQYPDRRAALIVITNGREPSGLSNRQLVQGYLERIMFGDTTTRLPPEVAQVPEQRLDALTGSYPLTSGGRIHLINDGVYLWAAAEGDDAITTFLRRSARDTGFANDSLARAQGTKRAGELLRGLLDRDTTALVDALMAAGAARVPEYVADWRTLVDRNGPLHRYAILGSTRAPNGVVTTLSRLHFLRATHTMAMFWANNAAGRLSGLSPAIAPYPVVARVASSTRADSLVAYDLLRLQTVATLIPSRDNTLLIVSGDGSRMRTRRVQRRIN